MELFKTKELKNEFEEMKKLLPLILECNYCQKKHVYIIQNLLFHVLCVKMQDAKTVLPLIYQNQYY